MPSSLDNLEEAIRKLQDLYDDPDIVIPASQLPEKPNPNKVKQMLEDPSIYSKFNVK